MILFLTDGREEAHFPSPVIAAADQAKAAGIVLIVLAVGDDADIALLGRVASTPDLVVRSAEAAAARMRWIIPCPDPCPGWPGR